MSEFLNVAAWLPVRAKEQPDALAVAVAKKGSGGRTGRVSVEVAFSAATKFAFTIGSVPTLFSTPLLFFATGSWMMFLKISLAWLPERSGRCTLIEMLISSRATTFFTGSYKSTEFRLKFDRVGISDWAKTERSSAAVPINFENLSTSMT